MKLHRWLNNIDTMSRTRKTILTNPVFKLCSGHNSLPVSVRAYVLILWPGITPKTLRCIYIKLHRWLNLNQTTCLQQWWELWLWNYLPLTKIHVMLTIRVRLITLKLMELYEFMKLHIFYSYRDGVTRNANRNNVELWLVWLWNYPPCLKPM